MGSSQITIGAPDQVQERGISRHKLSRDELTSRFAEALRAAKDIDREKALRQLAEDATEQQAAELMKSAAALPDKFIGATSFVVLAERLSEKNRTAAMPTAIKLADAVTDPTKKILAFAMIVPFAAKSRRASLISEIFKNENLWAEDGVRALVVMQLAPHMSADQIDKALAFIGAMKADFLKAQVLLCLPLQTLAHRHEALTIIDRHMADDRARAFGLHICKPDWMAVNIKHAFDIAESIRDERLRETTRNVVKECYWEMVRAHPRYQIKPEINFVIAGTTDPLLQSERHQHGDFIPRATRDKRTPISHLIDNLLVQAEIDPSARAATASEIQKVLTRAKAEIQQKIAPAKTVRRLPARAPRLWPAQPRGRAASGQSREELPQFIREVYGPYFPQFRNQLRAYIASKDRRLYYAIQNYERRVGELPPDVTMPSERDIARERFERAKREGLEALSGPERQSVTKMLWRKAKLER